MPELKLFKASLEYSNILPDEAIEEGCMVKYVFAESSQRATELLFAETGDDWNTAVIEEFPVVEGIVDA